MVTGDFPVDIYVKDVDASNAAPETDNLQKTLVVANRPQLCHYVGIAPLRLPPSIAVRGWQARDRGFPTNRHCPKLSASAETEAEAPFRDAGLT